MTPQINSILEQFVKKLRRQEAARTLAPVRRPGTKQESRRPAARAAARPAQRGVRRPVREEDEAFGPNFQQEFGDNDHQASAAGVGGASNKGDHNAALQKFMQACRDALFHSHGWEEGKADSHIRKVAADLASEGHLPPLPAEGDENEAEAIAMWLLAAPSVGFIAELLRTAAEQ